MEQRPVIAAEGHGNLLPKSTEGVRLSACVLVSSRLSHLAFLNGLEDYDCAIGPPFASAQFDIDLVFFPEPERKRRND